ncbi:hypothetical protein V6N11_069015 [Hibiscus sabdariffa]|uniref:Uncharacterized protein n=2 Tax=Hibiscus sabdariffa TaxID=183260 RepID=A0ABR1ZXQ1_9ROSI
MTKIALVVLSLALILSIQFVAGQDAAAETPASQMDEEQAFYLGVGIALDQMEKAGYFERDDVRSDLGKVDFHQAFEEAKRQENNQKAVFVTTFLNTMAEMVNSGLLHRLVYNKLFPSGGKTITPELDSALAEAYEKARKHEEPKVDTAKLKHEF